MNPDSRLHEIILKYHRGESLTEEEQAILDAETASLPSARVWERVRSHVERRQKAAIVRPWYTRRPVAWSAAAAAVALIAAGVYRYKTNYDRPPGVVATVERVWRTVAPGHFYQELEGPGGIEVVDSASSGQSVPYPVTLPDGSKVTLSYASSVRYKKDFAERKVILNGQAHFDVVKDLTRAFSVESGGTTVQVLGTRFNWMHYPNIPDEITLLDGKIGLTGREIQQELRPAERAVIHKGSMARVTVRKLLQPEKMLAWMRARPAIEFDSTDLYQVVQRMAQYYNVGYRVDRDLQAGMPVSGVMDLQRPMEENLEPIVRMLKDYDVRVVEKDGMIEVMK
jgi:ferric-dicitrate binding protein FerR (iron transport regulator)